MLSPSLPGHSKGSSGGDSLDRDSRSSHLTYRIQNSCLTYRMHQGWQGHLISNPHLPTPNYRFAQKFKKGSSLMQLWILEISSSNLSWVWAKVFFVGLFIGFGRVNGLEKVIWFCWNVYSTLSIFHYVILYHFRSECKLLRCTASWDKSNLRPPPPTPQSSQTASFCIHFAVICLTLGHRTWQKHRTGWEREEPTYNTNPRIPSIQGL